MGEMKPTPGEWVVESDDDGLGVVAYIGGFGYWVTGVISAAGPDSTDATKEANARLIAEAGTVFHNTGLSPVQLVEMVKELTGVLQSAVDCGMVPKSSALDGGASKYSTQVHVADRIRAALAKCEGVGNE